MYILLLDCCIEDLRSEHIKLSKSDHFPVKIVLDKKVSMQFDHKMTFWCRGWVIFRKFLGFTVTLLLGILSATKVVMAGDMLLV